MTHLARVAVDYASVCVAQGPLQIDLLHVFAYYSEVQRGIVRVCDHQCKLLHVPQNLLTDAFAGAVDADFDERTGQQHSGANIDTLIVLPNRRGVEIRIS